MSIIPVTFNKPKPKPVMRDVFDEHPRPWQLGEAKTGTCEIVDANYRRIATVQTGFIGGGHRETPQRIIDAINALP